jgi:hypothetical protein
MPDGLDFTHQRLPVSNYGSAIARALEWLGDRYLLAKPINAGVRPRGSAAETGHASVKPRQVPIESRARTLADNFR